MNDIKTIIRKLMYIDRIKTTNRQYHDTFHVSHRHGEFFALYLKNGRMAFNFRDYEEIKYWRRRGIYNYKTQIYYNDIPNNY